MIRFSLATTGTMILLAFAPSVKSHGGLVSPRSRNRVAREQGTEFPRQGVPPPEYCWHCLNDNNGVCGKSSRNDFDVWVDSVGVPMSWSSEATWTQGQVIQVEFEITANHWGHVELHACPKGRKTTQSCLNQYPLEFVEDVSYKKPKDLSYPKRGYLTGDKSKFTMKFRLPKDLKGSEVLLQWRYFTANSCNPPGYHDYYNGITNADKKALPAAGNFNRVLRECTLPYSNRGGGIPEQFWNCAEVSIAAESAPTSSAPPPPPVATSSPVSFPNPITVPIPVHVPVGAPVRAPVGTPASGTIAAPATKNIAVENPPTKKTDTGCCSFNFKTCIKNRHWCGTTEQDCNTCESVANWLPNGSLESSDCLPRFTNCNRGKCCPGLTCYELSAWYSQCLPSDNAPVPALVGAPIAPTPKRRDETCFLRSQKCEGGTCCPGLTCQKKKFWHRNPQCVPSDD